MSKVKLEVFARSPFWKSITSESQSKSFQKMNVSGNDLTKSELILVRGTRNVYDSKIKLKKIKYVQVQLYNFRIIFQVRVNLVLNFRLFS